MAAAEAVPTGEGCSGRARSGEAEPSCRGRQMCACDVGACLQAGCGGAAPCPEARHLPPAQPSEGRRRRHRSLRSSGAGRSEELPSGLVLPLPSRGSSSQLRLPSWESVCRLHMEWAGVSDCCLM